MQTQFYRRRPMASQDPRCSPMGQDWLSLANLYQEFWLSAFDLGTSLMDETLQMVSRTEPSRTVSRLLRPRRLCEVPRYADPDPWLGEVVRDAYVGETIRVPLHLKNKTRKTRTFHVDATRPVKNIRGEGGAVLRPNATTFTLLPFDADLFEVTLPISAEFFKPGFDYTTQIVITSEKCADQILGFRVRVLSEDTAPVIKLGCPCDPPVRRVNWYDHFYCDVRGCDDADDPDLPFQPREATRNTPDTPAES